MVCRIRSVLPSNPSPVVPRIFINVRQYSWVAIRSAAARCLLQRPSTKVYTTAKHEIMNAAVAIVCAPICQRFSSTECIVKASADAAADAAAAASGAGAGAGAGGAGDAAASGAGAGGADAGAAAASGAGAGGACAGAGGAGAVAVAVADAGAGAVAVTVVAAGAGGGAGASAVAVVVVVVVADVVAATAWYGVGWGKAGGSVGRGDCKRCREKALYPPIFSSRKERCWLLER